MNVTTSPANRSGDGPEEIDRLLAAFYSGEIPTPWPDLRAPVVTAVHGRGAGSLSAGRMALAASVAALLAGGWYLSGRLPMAPPNPLSLDAGNAVVPSDLRPGTSPLPTPPRRR
jgi:hypothetical protein